MHGVVHVLLDHFLFQSAPGREAGRCAQGGAVVVEHEVVSIRARP